MTSGTLNEVMARALARHPFSGNGGSASVLPPGVDVGALWDRLLEAHDVALSHAIGELTRRQRRLLHFGLASHLDHEGTTRVVAAMASADSVVWREAAAVLYLTTNGDAILRTAAQAHAVALVSEPLRSALGTARPLDLLLARYSSGRQPLARDFDPMPGTLWQWASRRARREALLKLKPGEVVAIEGALSVQGWRKELLSDSERIDWTVRYVHDTYATPWKDDDSFLIELVDRFHAPSDVNVFWERVEPAPREAVRQWLLGRELNELLQDSRRVAFWRRYLPHIRLVHTNADGEAVFVHFNGWFAVVFVQPGKATYMMHRAHGRSLRGLDEGQLYGRILDLSHRDRTLGRYEQRGSYWEYSAAVAVNDVMESF